MNILEPKATLDYVTENQAELIERVAKVCRASETISDNPNEFCYSLLRMNPKHVTPFRFIHLRYLIICSRLMSHELVRHQVGITFMQQSTRVVKQDSVIIPLDETGSTFDNFNYELWKDSCLQSIFEYNNLIDNGAQRQQARSVLPSCCATKIYVDVNFLEFMHMYNLRIRKNAFNEFRFIMSQCFGQLNLFMQNCTLLFKGEQIG